MAVYNLPNYLAKDGFGMALNIRRGNPNPLDNSSVWGSLVEAQNYAKSDPVAYVGQILTVVSDVVVDEVTTKTATAYVIDNEAGDLKEVGSSPVGDEKSITVSEDGTVSLYGIAGLALSREVEENGETVTKKITYQPLLVDGKLTWVEPSATTVEGLDAELQGVKTRVDTIESIIGEAADGENEATGLIKSVLDNALAIEELSKGREEDVDTFTEAITEVHDKIGILPENKTVVDLINDAVSDGEDALGGVEDRVSTIENDYAKKTDIPSVISAFTNDAKYQNDTEVASAIQAAIAKINHAVFQKVDAVPTVEAAVDNVLYLVPNGNKLDIYAKISGQMVLIDDTDTDLSGYALKSDLHEHANKTLLDTYTQTEENLADAVAKKHKHTFADVDVEDAITKKHAHGNATILDAITEEKVAAWDAAEANVISSVDEAAFAITDDKKLTLLDISIDKVTGLKSALDSKATKGKYLAEYGIEDAYTKEEVDNIHDELMGSMGEVAEEIATNIGTLQSKLDTIAEGAQVNVLESIKINGVAQAITDKSVNIPVATDTLLGVVLSSTAENKVSVVADGTMEVNSVNVNKLTQDEGTVLVLDGGSATTNF